MQSAPERILQMPAVSRRATRVAARAHTVWNLGALCDEHVRLPQIRDNLVRLVIPLIPLRHMRPPRGKYPYHVSDQFNGEDQLPPSVARAADLVGYSHRR